MPKIDRLFIAEKASVGKGIAEYLAKSTGAALQMGNQYATVGKDVVTWLSGHVLEQAMPEHYRPEWKWWALEHLPIVPDAFTNEPKPEHAQRIETIRRLLADCTTVVGAGDIDEEGQLLQDEVLLHLGNRKPVLRLWTSSLDDAALAKALSSMRPNSEYVGWYEAALSRQQADWLYGLNMTRACSLHARRAGADKKSVVYIGRVQTPTLALVVRRELEIRSFKAMDYYAPFLDLAPGFRASWSPAKDVEGTYVDERVDSEGRLTDKSKAQAIVAGARAAGQATVTHAEIKPGTESAPMPFSLSSLQAYCSRLFGLSAKDTLDIAQTLYTSKLTTYPRVDCEFLPTAQHGDAARILATLSKSTLPEAMLHAIAGADSGLKSKAWNDAKVTAHHAIIPAPLDNPADLGKLKDIELKVYCEIAKRYVLQFWPAAKFNATSIVLECASERYAASGRTYTDEGWRKAFATAETDGKGAAPALPKLSKGQALEVQAADLEAKRTTPPKRFEDGTFPGVLKNIHQFIADLDVKRTLKEGAGIGTEATRATIIEGLIRKGLLLKEGKYLKPSEEAIKLIGLLPSEMTTPDMTATWQQRNNDVRERTSSHSKFIEMLLPWLRDLVARSGAFFRPEHFPGGTPSEPAAPRKEWQVTDHECFGSYEKVGCGSRLKHIEGKYGMFFGCTNVDCKKTFRDVDGKPAERVQSAPVALDKTYACSSCNDPQVGFLRRIARKDGSGHFWGCSNWRAGCKASANDADGKPAFKQTAAVAV